MRVFFGPENTEPVYKMLHDEVSPTHFDLHDPYDYCRGRALELAREEIGDLPGSIAEAGVLYGSFARLMNRLFPDRKLFLYDTFEGHSKEDVGQASGNGYWRLDSGELEKGECLDYFTQLYKEATREEFNAPEDIPPVQVAEYVIARMPFPERCVPRVGRFPDTAAPDGEERFAFVSLDMNFYKPMRAGLEFFYPRLHEGGVIFAHDYNNPSQPGVKHAVRDMEELFGPFKKFPLPDHSGTLVIVK
ncbi:MAG: class I SAM-dependent methyltransferase [Holosporales bacterium]|nr:class I SAM-dependent methyltransferase [Holosporales bacterium]